MPFSKIINSKCFGNLGLDYSNKINKSNKKYFYKRNTNECNRNFDVIESTNVNFYMLTHLVSKKF